MFGKIAIRSIPAEIWEGLETLAGRHDRSVEAEARYAIRSWVEPLLKQRERSARRIEVSARLREFLDEVNGAIHRQPFKPSHIAQAIGEDIAESVEGWFSGEVEPSFKQLEAIANYLGGVSSWLQHGDRQMFPVDSSRIPEDPATAVTWLLDLSEPEIVTCLHFVRKTDESGALAIVKQYGDWRCKTHMTPYHVSEMIGAGGESSLACLAVIWELLYKHYTTIGTRSEIRSYTLPPEKFSDLLSGKIHPLRLLREASASSWWEDFWDVEQFREHEYWLGWRQVCERIYRVVGSSARHQEQLQLIRSRTHPFFETKTQP